MKRFFSGVLALLLALTVIPFASAAESAWLIPKTRDYTGQFTDVKGSWCESYVKTVYEAGLMEGKSPGCFDPSGILTDAQRLVIGVRLHALLHGKTVEQAAPGEPWWLPAARYYLAVDGNTTDDPAGMAEFADQPAVRLSFAHQMVWSTPAEDLPAINQVEEIPDFTEDMWPDDTLRQPALTLYRAGVLNGVDKWGKFDPRGTLTRGQAAAMLARVIDPSQRLKFTLPEFDLCRDVFQLEPTMVVLTLDDQSISAEIFALPLAEALRAWPADYTARALLEANRSIQIDVAAERLAAEKSGLSLDMVTNREDIPPAYVKSGVSQAAAVWRGEHDSLLSMLAFAYDPDREVFSPAFPNYSDAMAQALEDTIAQMTVTPSPALESLDLAAARARLLASPYCYY